MAVNTEESQSTLEENIKITWPPGFKATRNYTGEDEQDQWWYVKRFSKDRKSSHYTCYYTDRTEKERFRARRGYLCSKKDALRIRYESSDEIGAFVRLTNSYCMLCCREDAQHFLRTVKGDLAVPIINSSLAGCKVVGRMCVGNKNGLILPNTIYDTEIRQIRNELPETVKLATLDENLSALGNVIACNDTVALVHPDIDKETEEVIADTLQVEVFRHMIGNNPLVGSYCVLNNQGGLIQPEITHTELENLSSLLQIPLVSGTVNGGSKVIGAGMVINDSIAYAGMKTTSLEFAVIENIFHLYSCPHSKIILEKSRQA